MKKFDTQITNVSIKKFHEVIANCKNVKIFYCKTMHIHNSSCSIRHMHQYWVTFKPLLDLFNVKQDQCNDQCNDQCSVYMNPNTQHDYITILTSQFSLWNDFDLEDPVLEHTVSHHHPLLWSSLYNRVFSIQDTENINNILKM